MSTQPSSLSDPFASIPRVSAAAGLPTPLTAERPATDAANLPASKWPEGMVEAPTVDLYNRPTVHNPDGSISSVRSASFNIDGKETLLPTVSDDGRILTNDQAIAEYKKTGKHLGKFVSPDHADAYASALHDDYAAGKYGGQRSGQVIKPQTTPFNSTVPPVAAAPASDSPAPKPAAAPGASAPSESIFAGLRHKIVDAVAQVPFKLPGDISGTHLGKVLQNTAVKMAADAIKNPVGLVGPGEFGELEPAASEAINALRGRPNEPDAPIPQIKAEAAEHARELGIEFRGVQEGVPGAHPGLAIFQDPNSGTSIGVRLDQYNPEQLQKQLTVARDRMVAQPAPLATNASVEIAASTEAINRLAAEKANRPENQPGKEPFTGKHYSTVPAENDTLNGEDRGKAQDGSELSRLQQENVVPAVSVYREGVRPEPQIGTRAYRYPISGPKAIADIAGDERPIWENVYRIAFDEHKGAGASDILAHEKALNDSEAALRDAGYDGYENRNVNKGAVVLFGDQKVSPRISDWASDVSKRIATEPVGGIDPRTGRSDTTGHGTEIYPEAKERFADRPTGRDIEKFVERNKQLFENHPELRVGWDTDPSKSEPYELNIGATTPNREGAISVATKLDQRAAYDIGKKEEIPTGGENESTSFPAYSLEQRLNELRNGPPVKGSSVPLMSNPLKIRGTGEEGAVNTLDVAKALNKFSKNASDRGELNKPEDPAVLARVKPILEDEAKYQLAMNNSGEKWYTEDIAKHDAIAKQMRPELKDPDKMSVFKMAEAILSSGQKPYRNYTATLQAWDHYQNDGEFPEVNPETGKSWGPRNVAAYGNAFRYLNRLIDERGERGASEWLLSQHPIKELRDYNPNVAGKMNDPQFGVHILGPKRGPFAQNLHGQEAAFTADMWVSRSFNRWLGTMEFGPDKNGDLEIKSDAPRNAHERDLMKQAFQEVANTLGKSTSALQAILWYYEQGLYSVHGVPKESWSFSAAAERAAQEETNAINAEAKEAGAGNIGQEGNAETGRGIKRGGGGPEEVQGEDTGSPERKVTAKKKAEAQAAAQEWINLMRGEAVKNGLSGQ